MIFYFTRTTRQLKRASQRSKELSDEKKQPNLIISRDAENSCNSSYVAGLSGEEEDDSDLFVAKMSEL